MAQIVIHRGKSTTPTTHRPIQSTTLTANKTETDLLFYAVLQLSNFADERGLDEAGHHLENALDSLM